MDSETIGSRLERTGGVSTGFDYLRIGLSLAVLSWHSVGTSYGSEYELVLMKGPLCAVVRAVLPMFFALSGFLVCGSLYRSSSLLVFSMNRVLRLVPALSVEILLSALILGPLLTTMPLSSYLSAPEFSSYFLNMIGNIHFTLPGLFASNPIPDTVNRSLWTIPAELECYVALLALSAVGLLRRRIAFTFLLAAIWAVFTIAAFKLDWVRQWQEGVNLPGRLLVFAFLAGNALYAWRERIPLDAKLFALSVLCSAVTLARSDLAVFSPLPVAYATIYLGLTSPKKIPVLMDGDYSYGIYLFAYPIQQSYALLFPSARFWWANVLFTVPTSLLYAHISWNCIEKPVLARRRELTAMVNGALTSMRQAMLWRRHGASVSIDPGQTRLATRPD